MSATMSRRAPLLHTCNATGCQRRVPTYLLMCIEHWRMVPAALQREVLTAWSDRWRDPTWASRHEAAAAAAVAAVAEKQKSKQALRAELEGDLFSGRERHGPEESAT